MSVQNFCLSQTKPHTNTIIIWTVMCRMSHINWNTKALWRLFIITSQTALTSKCFPVKTIWQKRLQEFRKHVNMWLKPISSMILPIWLVFCCMNVHVYQAYIAPSIQKANLPVYIHILSKNPFKSEQKSCSCSVIVYPSADKDAQPLRNSIIQSGPVSK